MTKASPRNKLHFVELIVFGGARVGGKEEAIYNRVCTSVVLV